MKRYVVIITSVLALIGAMGCSKDAPATRSVPAESMRQTSFTLPDINGDVVDLDRFAGSTVLLVFGASWCPYCVKEIPALNEIAKKYTDGSVTVLFVDLDNSIEIARSFARKKKIVFPVLYDDGAAVAKRYGVSGIPANFVIDPQGVVRSFGPRADAAQKHIEEIQRAVRAQGTTVTEKGDE